MVKGIGRSDVEASVVVPCYNEKEVIGCCLDALINQKCDFPYEIIVVDDGSTDQTVENVIVFVEEAASRGIDMRVIQVNRGGPARARNIGVRESRGKYVLFIDADCEANPYWLNILVNKVRKKAIAGVGGPYRTKNSTSRIAEYVGLELEYRHVRMVNTHIDFVRSANACFRKDVLLEVGGFDEDFTSSDAEDTDLCFRMLRRGYRLEWGSRAWVWHRHPARVRHYLGQQLSRGFWRVLLYLKNPTWMKGDTYAGLETLAQPFVPVLTFLAVALVTMLGLPVSLPFIFFGSLITLILMNFRFLIWILKLGHSMTFLIFSISMLLLRSLAWAVGGVLGALRFLTPYQ